MPQYYGYSATCGCTSTHPFKGTPSGSLPVAMVLVLLYYILFYYYSKKKARETQKYRGKMTSRSVTSFSGMWLTSLTVTSLVVTHAQWSDPLRFPSNVALAVPIYYSGLIASQTYYKRSYISECTSNYRIIVATEIQWMYKWI